MTSSSNSSTSQSRPSKIGLVFLIFSLIGFTDAIWLTISYYRGHIGCNIIAGCQNVLSSNYSHIYNIPVALLGAVFYAFIIINALHYLMFNNKLSFLALKIAPLIGFLVSLYLIYLQLFVINAICIYCMLSATTSIILFMLALVLMRKKKINIVPENPPV
ncbi:MAG: hypothetical protein C3F02_00080 [Parcubacteria group bacterium]|nr:MAG: hypothetical protein C3F02_00080 [Parcubacteria group bacterium]